jgi:hypothetical protein
MDGPNLSPHNSSTPDRPTPPIAKEQIVAKVSEKVIWWIGRRRDKLSELEHSSHAVNPFLLPIIMKMHGFDSLNQLSAFMLSGHLVEGHATGFGKLVDEKILADVFGTIRLDGAFRGANRPYGASEFDNIDHLVPRPDGSFDLLSIKAGRWSIQLGQAVQLNSSFNIIAMNRAARRYQPEFRDLVVGVFYGKDEDLTDKYRIIRGEPTRSQHEVHDLTKHVKVLAGRPFWSWLNGGVDETQESVLEGIIRGYDRFAEANGSLAGLWDGFVSSFERSFGDQLDSEGNVNWYELLRHVNG